MGKLIEFNRLDKTMPQTIQNNSDNDKNMEFMKSFVTIPFTIEEILFLKTIIAKQYPKHEVAKTFKEKVFRGLTAGLKNVTDAMTEGRVITMHLIQMRLIYEVLLVEQATSKENTHERGLINRILYILKPKIKSYQLQLDEYSKLRESWQFDILSDDLSALYDYKYGDT